MQDEPNPNDARNLWQEQEVEKVTITVDEIRERAVRFQRRIHWRNMREYAAGVIMLPILALSLLHGRGWRLAPPVLLIVGCIYVLYQLHRRGSARPVPAFAGTTPFLEFHRLELERQRDALRGVWLWYILPFVPGFMASLVVRAIDQGINARTIGSGVGLVVVCVGVWRLNERAARKLDGKIQEVRAVETGP